MFSDKTSSIDIELRTYSPSYLRITISLNKDKLFSNINIGYESDNPREVVTGIYDGIKRIIETQRYNSKMFHPDSVIKGFLIAIFFGSFIYAIENTIKKRFYPGIISSFIFILILFYLGAGILKPYISFESNRYFKLKKLSDWFFWGFLTFLIFGTILALLRKSIFGL